MRTIKIPKLHNKATITEDSAEILLYGEVIDHRPVDFWTGEALPGHFICMDEFLEDLEAVKDHPKVTFRLFSLGGDLPTGLAISARIRDMQAETTAICDGVIASAATAIAMGADHTKAHASDQVMIHDPSAFLYGYYDLHDLKGVEKALSVGVKSLVEIYTAKTGLDQEAIKSAVMATTWLTGREAVEKGYIDELIEGESVDMAMTADASMLLVNGIYQPLRGRRLPDGMTVRNDAPPVKSFIKTIQLNGGLQTEEGGKKLYTTVDELRNDCPDLVDQIEKAALERGRAIGAEDENKRLADIERIQDTIGDPALIANAKYGEAKCSAPELLYQAATKGAAVISAHVGNRQAELREAGITDVKPAPVPDENGAPLAEVADDVKAEQEAKLIAKHFGAAAGR